MLSHQIYTSHATQAALYNKALTTISIHVVGMQTRSVKCLQRQLYLYTVGGESALDTNLPQTDIRTHNFTASGTEVYIISLLHPQVWRWDIDLPTTHHKHGMCSMIHSTRNLICQRQRLSWFILRTTHTPQAAECARDTATRHIQH